MPTPQQPSPDGGSTSLAWVNGAFHEESRIPISDRGFRYGLALFETLRISAGRAMFTRKHLEKLAQAAREAGWWGENPLDGAAQEALAEILNGPNAGPWTLPVEGIARIHLTAGDGDFTSVCEVPRLYLTTEPRNPPAPELYQRGISVRVHADPITPQAPGLKSHNYWGNLAALKQARAAGYHEACLVNPGDELISFCLGNVFLVRDGKVLTPRQESGARPGVMRDWVLQELRHTASEVQLRPEDLASADEIFLTNSGIGVLPVTRCGERPLPVGAVTQRLVQEFARLTAPSA